MKTIQMTCLKYSVLLVVGMALNLTSALSAQASPSDGFMVDPANAGYAVKVKTYLAQGAAGEYRYVKDESDFMRPPLNK